MRRAIRDSEHAERKARWHHWFDNRPTATLERNKLHLDSKGLNNSALMANAGMPEDPTERTAEVRKAVQKKFQRCTKMQISKRSFVQP